MGDVSSDKIPFGNLQASGMEELAGASPSAFNVVTEPTTGVIRRRPGLMNYFTKPVFNADGNPGIDGDGITGLYETSGGNLFAVGNGIRRNIYRVTPTGYLSLSTAADGDIRGSLRPIFAETEALLVVAGGKEPQKIVLSTSASSRLGGTPPEASHIIYNATRLLANEVVGDPKSAIRYSDTALGTSYTGHETWSDPDPNVSGFFMASARADPVTALWDNTNEISAFGNTSLQVFGPTGIPAFSPITANEYGCGASYSVIKVNQAFAWIDQFRRIVLSDGRQTEVISDPIQRELTEMGGVSDAVGHRVVIGPLDILFWVFPTEARAFAFQKGAGWAEWAVTSSSLSEQWDPLPITSTAQLLGGATIAGTDTGLIGTFTLGTGDFGTDIDARMTTGFQDRGTDHRKSCRSVRLVFRPTSQVDSQAAIARLSYRDDLGAWEPPLDVMLGRDPVVQFDSLGVYRRRQWRFEFTGSTDVVLVSATEDFEILEN